MFVGAGAVDFEGERKFWESRGQREEWRRARERQKRKRGARGGEGGKRAGHEWHGHFSFRWLR